MNYKNYMEDVVTEVFRDFINRNPKFCSCKQCQMDTIILALTHLRGKYAASLEGEVLVKVSRDDRQVKADALIAIIQAAEMVSKNPKH